MNSVAAALALLAVAAGPVSQRSGSAQFQVSVRVVAAMRVTAPGGAELTARSSPVYAAPRYGALVARFAPSAAVRGGTPVVLVGVPGSDLRACAPAADGSCEVPIPRSVPSDGLFVVAAFVPDGAATRISEE